VQREGCRRLWRFRIQFDLTPIFWTPLDLRFPATLDEGQFAMKKSKFTQEQIVFAPRLAAPGPGRHVGRRGVPQARDLASFYA